jgi:hypothetical protein
MFRHRDENSLVYVLLLTAGLVGCSKDLSRSRGGRPHQSASGVQRCHGGWRLAQIALS